MGITTFADDLLAQAYHLANKDGDPIQASLRRTVSTAYYALFHLLIDDAVGKWLFRVSEAPWGGLLNIGT